MIKDLLFRQVHPDHFKNGLSSGAFRPTPRDDDKLSVDCGNMTTPQASYELHLKKTKLGNSTEREFLKSAGTWAIPRDSCRDENLPVIPDEVKEDPFQPNNPAHHLVDFSGISGMPAKKNDLVAKRLRQKALELGQLWPKP